MSETRRTEREKMSVDLTKVSGLELSTTEPTPTTNSDETLMIMDEVSFETAKKEELESWKRIMSTLKLRTMDKDVFPPDGSVHSKKQRMK